MKNITHKVCVETELICSEDGENTYEVIKRLKGVDGETGVIVMLFPTKKGDNIYSDDNTTNFLISHMKDLGLNEIRIINLFSKVSNSRVSARGLQVDTDIALAMRVLEEIGVSKPGLKGIKFDEESNSVTIDFKSDASVLQSGTAGETQILQSLALTYILGKNVDSIYYNVDGEIYSSGHYYFEPDGFYISKNILLNNWDELFPKVVTQ